MDDKSKVRNGILVSSKSALVIRRSSVYSLIKVHESHRRKRNPLEQY